MAHKGKHKAAAAATGGGRGKRVAVVAVGVMAATLLVGVSAAEADTIGVQLCVKTGYCSIMTPNGVRWQ